MRLANPTRWTIYLVVAWTLVETSAYPIKTTDDAMAYLKRFGYYEDRKARELMIHGDMKHGMERMVMDFQELMGLEETGKLDAPTLKKMNAKRCGNPDMISGMKIEHGRATRFVKNSQGWRKSVLTYTIRRGNQTIAPFHKVEKEVNNAIGLWSNAAQITFRQLPHDTNEDVDIEIKFEGFHHSDPFPFDGPGNTVAHAFPPGNQALNGDIHFDSDEIWDFGVQSDNENFAWVAAHELGHSLGLSHSNEIDSIMQPEVQDYDPNMSLGWDDIAGIQDLYGPKLQQPEGSGHSGDRQRPENSNGNRNNERPQPCDQRFNVSAATIDQSMRKLYIFAGTYIYQFDYPLRGSFAKVQDIGNFFSMSANRTKTSVDAAFTDNIARLIYLFTGPQVWRIRDMRPVGPSPLNIQDLFPGYGFETVDAAFKWRRKIYLIKNNRAGHDLATWHVRLTPGIAITAAISDEKNGKIYLFGKRQYWTLVPSSVRGGPPFTTENDKRTTIRSFLKCPAVQARSNSRVLNSNVAH